MARYYCIGHVIIPHQGRSRRQLLHNLLRLWHPYCVALRFREPAHSERHTHSSGHNLGHADPLIVWEQIPNLEEGELEIKLLDIPITLQIGEPSPTCSEVILKIDGYYFDSYSFYNLLPPEHVQWFIDSWLLLCESLQARAAWLAGFSEDCLDGTAQRTLTLWRSAAFRRQGHLLLKEAGVECWLLYLGPDLLQQPATRQALASCEASLATKQQWYPTSSEFIAFGRTSAGGWFARSGFNFWGSFAEAPTPMPQGGRGFALLAPTDSSPDQHWPQRARSLLRSLLLSLHEHHSLLAHCVLTDSHFERLGQTSPLDKSFHYTPVHSLPWEAVLQLLDSPGPHPVSWQLQFADVPGLLHPLLTSFGDVTLDLQWDPQALARLSPEQETSFALAWASLWHQHQAPYAFLVRLGFHDEACSWVRFAFRLLPLLRRPSPASFDPLLQESSRFYWLTFLGSHLLLALDPPQWQALLLRLCQQDARLFLLLPQQPPLALSDPAAAPSAPVLGSSLLLLRSRFAPGLDPDSFLSQHQQERELTRQ
uniref:Uncharacterized protein n=1 Tax=Thermogemmatispora argillosa TaxID=2045280 RepID=A0A455T0L7_9CHLR|nr:hypothetical protein KTA_15970 [Thermogemmatispora argillosa]